MIFSLSPAQRSLDGTNVLALLQLLLYYCFPKEILNYYFLVLFALFPFILFLYNGPLLSSIHMVLHCSTDLGEATTGPVE